MHFFVIRIMIQVFIMLLLSCITSGKVEYYVIRNETTWDKATASCTLATPDIIYSGTSYTADVNVSNLGLNQGDRLWLGYFTAYTIFQYIGCMKVMDIISSANYSINAKPGDCYSACGKSGNIGMKICFCICYERDFMLSLSSDTQANVTEAFNDIFRYLDDILKLIANYQSQCFCLESQLNLSGYEGSGCDNGCSDKESVTCGGDQYASIYEPVLDLPFKNVRNHPTSVAGANGDCVEYDPTSGDLFWRACSSSLQGVCQREPGGDLFPLQSDTQYNNWIYNNWMHTTTACFKASLYPLTYRSLNRSHGDLTSTLWTGMFRSLVIYKYNGKVEPQHNINIQVEEGRVYVEFFSGLSTTYYSLCQRELTTELPTSTYTKQTNIIETNTESKDTEQSSEEMTNTTTSNNLHTYVGVAVGILVLISIIIPVVVIVVRRKRKHEPKAHVPACKQNVSTPEHQSNVTYSETGGSMSESAETEFSHVAYETGDNIQDVYTKAKKNAKTATTTHNTIDDTYDTTSTSISTAAFTKRYKNTENVYNSLTGVEADTYNHTDTAIKALQMDCHNISGISSSATGNTLVGNSFTENVYDRTNNMNDVNEDTYNHLNQGLKLEITNDDLYAKSGSHPYTREITDTTYDIAGESNKDKKQAVIDNTYSHAIFTSNNSSV